MNQYSIYQLNDSPEAMELIFCSYDHIQKHGVTLTPDLYHRIYQSEAFAFPDTTRDMELLDQVYARFNVGKHPAYYTGHSISVSDVIAIQREDQVCAYYCDSMGWVELPDFTRSLQQHLENEKQDKELDRTLTTEGLSFRVDESHYLTISETDSGEAYRYVSPSQHEYNEGSISFEELRDLASSAPNDPQMIVLLRAVLDQLGLQITPADLVPLNPDGERNFRIQPVDNGYLVHSDSERFGKDAVVYQSPNREDCMKYIADRQVEATPWRCYIIPDLMTWARPSRFSHDEISPIEYYDSFDEAAHRFTQLLRDPRNHVMTHNQQTGIPFARLTFGIHRDAPSTAIDLIHVRAGKNYLDCDFLNSPRYTTSPQALEILRRLETEIGFDVMDFPQQAVDFPISPTSVYQPLPIDKLLSHLTPSDLRPIVPSQEQEQLFRIDDQQLLHIKTTTASFDYRLMDEATAQLRAAGRISKDHQPRSVATVRNEIYARTDLHPRSVERVPLGSFGALLNQGKQDAAAQNAAKTQPRTQGEPTL